MEGGLATHLLANKPLANRHARLKPPVDKTGVAGRLDAIDGLWRRPLIGRYFGLDHRIFLGVDINDEDVARRLEEIVEGSRRSLCQFEIGLYLRHAWHVGTHSCLHQFECAGDILGISASVVLLPWIGHSLRKRTIRHNHQTLVDTTRGTRQCAPRITTADK